MHKIEYYIDGDGPRAYNNKLDLWEGKLYEIDYENIVENLSLWHAKWHVAYDSFPCDIELVINGESVGVFNVELQPVPEFTAKRITND